MVHEVTPQCLSSTRVIHEGPERLTECDAMRKNIFKANLLDVSVLNDTL